ncbi:hypothetical protein CIK69_07660 [Brachybacterium alimentarium]|uniref:SRPBCC domain-containing protein n=1 Tax=Brachybacterium alimentarium TaxID=47845 RepID=UPI000DF21219|nr:SRPBCC domain-containing protein [Brachybacterium alimentarium]RCS90472.1 hypothetical protein CIK69_07660 [Brachybacterium alimentarium]
MAITGFLDHDGHDLVLTRSVLAPRSLIWDHLTRSDLLNTWFGTFTGDPTTGRVLVTMTAEPGEDSASEYTIHACEPAELLTVSTSSGEGGWRLSVELVDALGSGTADAADATQGAHAAGATDAAGAADEPGPSDPSEPVTRVRLRHHDVPTEMIRHVGPGWEWYLDRLVGVVTGGEVPGMDVWDSRYMTLGDDYAALTE